LNPLYAAIATKIVEYAGLDNHVKILVGNATKHISTLKAKYGVQKIDVLFLDHWKDAYLPDLKLFEESGLLQKGTVIVADNVVFPGAPGYLEYIRAAKDKYESKFIESNLEYSNDIVDGFEVSVCL
jgi:catechol O-methyltransferase